MSSESCDACRNVCALNKRIKIDQEVRKKVKSESLWTFIHYHSLYGKLEQQVSPPVAKC